MINKEHLWFLTLFSLILVLSVYYITMPSDLLLSKQVFNDSEEKTEPDENVNLEVEESDILVSLRLDLDEERETEKKELKSILTDGEKTIEDYYALPEGLHVELIDGKFYNKYGNKVSQY